jgi:hypothetical protein
MQSQQLVSKFATACTRELPVLSNMDPVVRRSCERYLVETYYKALCVAGVNNNTNEQSPNQNNTSLEVTLEFSIAGKSTKLEVSSGG